MRVGSLAMTCAGLVALTGPALAQDAATTCAKMQAEDRIGAVSVAQCQCWYSVAEQVVDDDIRTLIFDAWYTGRDNMALMEQLRPRARVRRQLNAMAQALDKYCQ
ncbi:hypothetical protein [uncultured Tateyamaria sp.]|uniref:hypothetical protein n=1 Tax=uncultured Tateyamaria sp. TaxID=455651 RepID=UPI00262256C5|nr:hypothetical protein [uncultured Tateyamaria sp.]